MMSGFANSKVHMRTSGAWRYKLLHQVASGATRPQSNCHRMQTVCRLPLQPPQPAHLRCEPLRKSILAVRSENGLDGLPEKPPDTQG